MTKREHMSGEVALVDMMPTRENAQWKDDAFMNRIARSARESLLLLEKRSAGEISVYDWFDDMRLVRYLAKSDPMHSSPFEHVTLSFEMTMPLAMAVHVFRHRTFSYNGFSHRYANAKDAPLYIPPRDAMRKQAAMNKQASGEPLSEEDAKQAEELMRVAYDNCISAYEALIELGLCRERARFVLPEGGVTSFVMTGNLLNFARFLRTRGALDTPYESPVQEETRSLAEAMHQIMYEVAPETMKVLDEYVIGAKMVPRSVYTSLKENGLV